jgi:hypothetical protein
MVENFIVHSDEILRCVQRLSDCLGGGHEEELADNRSIEDRSNDVAGDGVIEQSNLVQSNLVLYNPIPRDTATRLSAIARTKTIVNGNFSKFILQDAILPLDLLFATVTGNKCPRIQIRTSRWASNAFRSEERGRILISGVHNFMQFMDRIRWFFDLSRWPSRKF